MTKLHSTFCSAGWLILLAALASLACIQQVRAENLAQSKASVTATPSRTSVQVAEPLWLDLTVTAPAGAKVTFPATGDRLGEFDILDTQDRFDIPTTSADGWRTWTRRLQLESIITGDLQIPVLEIQVADAASADVIRSQPVTIRIASVLEGRGDPTQFRDIQSVVDVTVPNEPSRAWLVWSLAGLSAVAMSICAAVIVARHKRWQTPAEWADQQLDELERSPDLSQGKAPVESLAEIMRSFLQLQFTLSEPGHTSDELLQTLEEKQFVAPRTLKPLGALFTLADETKFAGRKVSPANFQALLADVRRLVHKIASAADAQTTSTTTPAPAATDDATTEAR